VTEDQIVAIYGSIKTLAQSMAAREAALDKKTAAIDAAIAELKQLPSRLASRPASTSVWECGKLWSRISARRSRKCSSRRLPN
jgi:hypothetical protein